MIVSTGFEGTLNSLALLYMFTSKILILSHRIARLIGLASKKVTYKESKVTNKILKKIGNIRGKL